MIVVFCSCFVLCLLLLLLLLLLCFHVVMLLSKLEAGKNGVAKKRNNFQSKPRGAIMFPNVKSMVFLFLLSDMCMCVSSKAQ